MKSDAIAMIKIKFLYDPQMPWFDHWRTALDDRDSPRYGRQICLCFGWAVLIYKGYTDL